MLELHLMEAYEHVDWFVIAEATHTFTGKKKRLFFQENAERYTHVARACFHFVCLVQRSDDDLSEDHQQHAGLLPELISRKNSFRLCLCIRMSFPRPLSFNLLCRVAHCLPNSRGFFPTTNVAWSVCGICVWYLGVWLVEQIPSILAQNRVCVVVRSGQSQRLVHGKIAIQFDCTSIQAHGFVAV